MNKQRGKAFAALLEDYMNAPIQNQDVLERVRQRAWEQLVDQRYPEVPVKKDHKTARRIGIIAACVVGCFALLMLVPNMPVAQAFQFEMQKQFNWMFHPAEEVDQNGNIHKRYADADAMQRDIDMKLPRFSWLPDGFCLSDLLVQKAPDGRFLVANYTYNKTGEKDSFLDITATWFPLGSAPSQVYSTSELQKYTINGREAAIAKDPPHFANFFYTDEILVGINGSVPKDDIIKIIQNTQ